MAADLILASTSPYRRDLLARLGVAFRQLDPATSEQARPRETPARLARRLARAKAAAVAARFPDAVVLGSDQVVSVQGQVLGKPGDAATARQQLAALSGRRARVHTAVCCCSGGVAAVQLDVTDLWLRPLDDDAIARYLDIDRPFDCAGSFKAEAAGIALFERIRSNDPTALVGLPLIATAGLLRAAGIAVPGG